MASDFLDSYIAAQNFCTGSQADYSTCITNNLRFLEFLDDTYEALEFFNLRINNSTIPYINGITYTEPIPVAIADIFTRIMMVNSYGVVDFRCSEVFSRPRLPLPSLQELGLASQDIINIIGVPPPTLDDPNNTTLFEGIPINTEDTLFAWMYNVVNLTIGYVTKISNSLTYGKEIEGVINGMLDYYELPDKSILMKNEADSAFRVYNKIFEYTAKIISLHNEFQEDIYTLIESTLQSIENNWFLQIRTDIQNKVVDPLSVINGNTDFSHFDFTITEQVATDLKIMRTEWYPFVLSFGFITKQESAFYGIPPDPGKTLALVAKQTMLVVSQAYMTTVADIMNLISRLYNEAYSLGDRIEDLEAQDIAAQYYLDQRATLVTRPKNYLTEPEAVAILDQMDRVLDTYSLYYNGKYLPNELRAILPANEGDHVDSTLLANILDEYFEATGKQIQIENSHLAQLLADYTRIDNDITVINLGADYRDSGTFYYADIAYVIGFTKLEYIHSIQIDDEYYSFKDILDEDGNPIGAISESGCTKYTFTRHVLPTYDAEVEMYLYPGTPQQAYCSTINRYHNFATSKYSGMFTKQVSETEVGLFIFQGYRPMQQTVEEVVQLGRMDFNSINLNDPSLDQKSYSTMLMKEIKNLTNASTINGNSISTDDFKYYISSELDNPGITNNYPGLAILEFKRFPLGKSLKIPKIRIKVTGGDFIT